MARVDEIAPDIFRISTYVPEFNLQFNQFVVRDDEPLLFETGMKQIFPSVREAVSKVIEPASLRYVSFSHFEPDECGSLNEWQIQTSLVVFVIRQSISRAVHWRAICRTRGGQRLRLGNLPH